MSERPPEPETGRAGSQLFWQKRALHAGTSGTGVAGRPRKALASVMVVAVGSQKLALRARIPRYHAPRACVPPHGKDPTCRSQRRIGVFTTTGRLPDFRT